MFLIQSENHILAEEHYKHEIWRNPTNQSNYFFYWRYLVQNFIGKSRCWRRKKRLKVASFVNFQLNRDKERNSSCKWTTLSLGLVSTSEVFLSYYCHITCCSISSDICSKLSLLNVLIQERIYIFYQNDTTIGQVPWNCRNKW